MKHGRKAIPAYYSTILRLEQFTFYNAFNLLNDACLLYENKSFSTSCALAILAFEELGKLHMLDHIGFEARLSEKSERSERLKHLFSRDLFLHHGRKQEWAAVEIGRSKTPKRLLYGRLERIKHKAFYIGFVNGRITNPGQITVFQAYAQIRYALQVLKQTRDLPFFGVFEDSTKRTRKHAAKFIDYLNERFQKLAKPK